MDDRFQRFLLPGERLLWTGRPPTGFLFRPIDWFLIPFSVIWAAFAVFWNWNVWTGNAPLAFKLFGLPFLAAGAYFVAGRFLLDSRDRARTGYAVTDRRVLILKKGGDTLRSLDVGSLPSLELSERKDGSGSIRFGPTASIFMSGNAMWHPALDPTPAFVRVPGVRDVYTQIQKQAAEARRRTA